MHSLTFFPKSQAAYSGSVLDIDNLGYDSQFVASFEAYEAPTPKVFSAMKRTEETANLQVMQASLNPTMGYKIEEVRIS